MKNKVTIVKSAQYWYNQSQIDVDNYDYANAYVSLMQAFNHTESALSHLREKVPGVKDEMERVEKR